MTKQSPKFLVSEVLLIVCLTNVVETSAVSSPQAPSSRFTVFISDLHFGVGRDRAAGKWYKEEDFRWAKEFRLFLQEIDRLGKGATDLVLNGDTFELWQSLKEDCTYQDRNLGCTQGEALGRLKVVLAAHAAELRYLAEFASSGDNRIIIVPGNHDVALLFPAVAKAALHAMATSPSRVQIASNGYWLSSDSRVYAEHGQQIGKEVNRLDNWPMPFIEKEGRRHLQRPWGEQFVQEYYNDYEAKYPIIDNIASEQEGILLGLAAEGPVGGAKAFRNFFKFCLFQVSWEQFGRGLSEEGELPQWDIKRIRDEEGDRFLVDSLPRGHFLKSAAMTALQDNKLEVSLKDLTDDEIADLCDKRAALRRKGEDILECPRTSKSLEAVADYLMRSRDAVFKVHLENTYKELAGSRKASRRFDVFIYGHTHKANAGFKPLRSDDWQPEVVNTGAWQRVVTPERLSEIKKSRGINKEEVLPSLEPDDLPPCYSAILLEAYEKQPQPQLRFWRLGRSGVWGLSESCD